MHICIYVSLGLNESTTIFCVKCNVWPLSDSAETKTWSNRANCYQIAVLLLNNIFNINRPYVKSIRRTWINAVVIFFIQPEPRRKIKYILPVTGKMDKCWTPLTCRKSTHEVYKGRKIVINIHEIWLNSSLDKNHYDLSIVNFIFA